MKWGAWHRNFPVYLSVCLERNVQVVCLKYLDTEGWKFFKCHCFNAHRNKGCVSVMKVTTSVNGLLLKKCSFYYMYVTECILWIFVITFHCLIIWKLCVFVSSNFRNWYSLCYVSLINSCHTAVIKIYGFFFIVWNFPSFPLVELALNTIAACVVSAFSPMRSWCVRWQQIRITLTWSLQPARIETCWLLWRKRESSAKCYWKWWVVL